MKGSKIPPELETAFREKYLELGIVKKAAEAVGMPVSTGYAAAVRAKKDPEFAKAWDDLRTLDVPELAARINELAATVAERINTPDPTPEELAGIAVANNLKSFSYQNPKPQYLRGLVDWFKALNASRSESGGAGDGSAGPLIVINEAKIEKKPESTPEQNPES